MWYDFQMHLGGGGEQSGESARRWIAGLANQLPPEERLDMGLFEAKHQATDDGGHPRDGVATIRFGAGREMVRMYAIGETACDLLAREGHKVTRMLSRHLGRGIKEVRKSGTCHIEPSPYLRQYSVRALVLKHYRWDDFKALRVCDPGGWDQPSVKEAIAQTIVSGLREQAVLLSLDGMGLDFEAPEDILVDVQSVEKIVPVEVKPGSRRFRLVAQKVAVRINVRLEGVWHVGRLTSRGYGLIRGAMGWTP